MEWVLLCSAFEHILEADSKATNVACRFAKHFTPSDELLGKNATRFSDQQGKDDKSVRYEWMREFYRIRGNFAHGQSDIRQPTTWNPIEHLLLATIAFPLLVKSLLNKACKYNLNEDDQAHINVFEKFADTHNFLRPPTDQKNSLDSHWKRLVNERSSKMAMKRAFEQARNSLTPEQPRRLEENPDKENA